MTRAIHDKDYNRIGIAGCIINAVPMPIPSEKSLDLFSPKSAPEGAKLDYALIEGASTDARSSGKL